MTHGLRVCFCTFCSEEAASKPLHGMKREHHCTEMKRERQTHPRPVRWVQPLRSRERKETRQLRGASDESPRPSQLRRLSVARRLRLARGSRLEILRQPCRFTSTIRLRPARREKGEKEISESRNNTLVADAVLCFHQHRKACAILQKGALLLLANAQPSICNNCICLGLCTYVVCNYKQIGKDDAWVSIYNRACQYHMRTMGLHDIHSFWSSSII